MWLDQNDFSWSNREKRHSYRKIVENLHLDITFAKLMHRDAARGNGVDLRYKFNISVINALWTLINGKALSLEDPELADLVKVNLQYNVLLVFPDEMNTKLKMYEFMNIFPILTWILQKSCKRSFFIFTEQTVKKSFTFWTGVVRQMH